MSHYIFNFENYRELPDLDLAVLSSKHSCQNNPDFHSHNFYELVLVYSGTAWHSINSVSIPIRSGDIILIPPGTVHAFLSANNLFVCNILFCHKLFASLPENLTKLPAFAMLLSSSKGVSESDITPRQLSLEAEQLKIALNYSSQLNDELKQRKMGADTMAYGLFLLLLTHCLRNIKISGLISESIYTEKITQLLSLLDQHPEKNWTLQSMAKNAGMSVANFRLHFFRMTGRTPGKYLTALRLEKAAYMLQNTLKSISQIAYRSGFTDSNYFSRRFHLVYGKSPKDYRKSYFIPNVSGTTLRKKNKE